MRTDPCDEPIRVNRFSEGRDLAIAMLRRCPEATDHGSGCARGA